MIGQIAKCYGVTFHVHRAELDTLYTPPHRLADALLNRVFQADSSRIWSFRSPFLTSSVLVYGLNAADINKSIGLGTVSVPPLLRRCKHIEPLVCQAPRETGNLCKILGAELQQLLFETWKTGKCRQTGTQEDIPLSPND